MPLKRDDVLERRRDQRLAKCTDGCRTLRKPAGHNNRIGAW